MRDGNRGALYSGGFGSGKSWALCFRALRELQQPGAFVVLGRRHLPELRLTTFRDFFEVLPPEWLRGFNKAELRGQLRNGAEFAFRPFSDTSSVRGLTVSAVAVDEWSEVPEDVTLFLRGRLRKPGFPGHLFGVSNPAGRDHYLHRDYVDPATRGAGNAWYHGTSLENVFTPPAYRLDLLRSYVGQMRSRYVEGEWIDWSGRVWPSAQAACSLVRAADLDLPAALPRELAIDFGWEHAFACLWGAWDERVSPPRLIVYREHVVRHKLLREHAQAIHEGARAEPAPFAGYRRVWADHDAQDRFELANLAERHLRLQTSAARKDVRLGVASVEGGFRPRADGLASILISDACPITWAQVVGLRWKERRSAGDPEQWVETNAAGESIDDAADALRMLWYSHVADRFEREPTYQPGTSHVERASLYARFRATQGAA